jgi:hypothetical protein
VTKAELEAALHAQDQRFQGRLDVLEARIGDQIREAAHETETKVLEAFYAFAESNNRRLGQQELASASLTNRVSTLENRVLEIEKRLNIPPVA